MRAVILTDGVVTGIVADLAGKTVDADGRAARGPATYAIEGPGGREEVEYEAVLAAPEGSTMMLSEEAGIGWRRTENGWRPPPVSADEVAQRKAGAALQIIAYADAITARITAAYPASEVMSWPTREAEARIVASGGDLPAWAILPGLAEDAGQTLAAYAAGVIARADAYRAIVRAMTAIRVQAQGAIAAAGTPAEIDAALAAAKALADARAAEMGLAPAAALAVVAVGGMPRASLL